MINLATVAEQLGELEEATRKAEEALRLAREIEDREGIVAGLTILGRIQRLKGEPESAAKLLHEGLEMAEEIQVKSLTQAVYTALSDTYADLKDYSRALDFHRLYSETKDEMINEVSHSKVAELEARYESEKRKNEIAISQAAPAFVDDD